LRGDIWERLNPYQNIRAEPWVSFNLLIIPGFLYYLNNAFFEVNISLTDDGGGGLNKRSFIKLFIILLIFIFSPKIEN